MDAMTGVSADAQIAEPYVLISKGPHSADTWAWVTALDMIRVDTDDAKALRLRIRQDVAIYFDRVMSTDVVIDAVVKDAAKIIIDAFSVSPWPDHLSSDRARRDLSAMLYRHLSSAREIAERCAAEQEPT